MNRLLVPAGVALSAVVTLTGCGGNKKAATVGQSASARARHGAPATRAPTASATVAGTVKTGGFCKNAGTVGRTANGTWARCLKRTGDKRPRWYSVGRSRGAARPGEFCSPAGSTGTSSTGARLTCTKKAGENRPRWRVK